MKKEIFIPISLWLPRNKIHGTFFPLEDIQLVLFNQCTLDICI